MIIVVFDVGRTLPNKDLSRDFMELVVDGSMGLGRIIASFALIVSPRTRMVSPRSNSN